MDRTMIIDVFTDKAQYALGDAVTISIQYRNQNDDAFLQIGIVDEFEVIHKELLKIWLCDQPREAVFTYLPKASQWRGFGVACAILAGGRAVSAMSTAFDVAPGHKTCPRYGFVSNFGSEDDDNTKDIEWLNRLHINVAQFYDWMYRHDNLLPPGGHYTDAMGRALSLDSVRNKIKACHERGIKATAYGAIYAASKKFYKSHEDWGMYDNGGRPVTLSDWLYLMDISPQGGWTGHIAGQFTEAMRQLGFDGIHLDTYGFPRKYYTKNGELIDYSAVVNPFLDRVRQETSKVNQDAILIYNNVNDFPTDTVVRSTVDAVYIEVWEPNRTYREIYELCRKARLQCSKPIIFAAYIEAFTQQAERGEQFNSWRMASAVIFASGAHHLVMGGYRGILHGPYYAEYSLLEDSEAAVIRRYYDYIVRYGHILFDPELNDTTMVATGGINDGFIFRGCETSNAPQAGKVWTMIRESEGNIVIHLVNLSGLDHDEWNTPQRAPSPVYDIQVEAMVYEDVLSVDIASPDFGEGSAVRAEYSRIESQQGIKTVFSVPRLDFWTTVYIKIKE